MSIPYKHTQVGYVILGSIGAAILLTSSLMLINESRPVALVVLVILVASGVLFANLTIEIDAERLHASFGPGLIHRTIPLQDIAAVEQVQTPWYYGWGIRWTPQGTLYNVSGKQAIKITLQNGRTVLFGTDEPDALCNALRRHQG